ncbi:MAG: SHOCT domain-containing protein [Chthoniobacteraceae bacterium]|jgi:hypothetical protein
MKNPLLSLLAAIVLPLSLSGCLGLSLGLGGGKKKVTESNSENYNYNVTLGQQLLDLQKAYDAGVITESQYNHEKKKLLHDYR